MPEKNEIVCLEHGKYVLKLQIALPLRISKKTVIHLEFIGFRLQSCFLHKIHQWIKKSVHLS